MTGALFKLRGAELKGVNIKTIALQTFVHSPIVVGFLEIGFSIRKCLKKKHWWPRASFLKTVLYFCLGDLGTKGAQCVKV